jgi:glycosidase
MNITRDSVFYHIYPLGFCGAAQRNDFTNPAGAGLRNLVSFIPHLKELRVNALYLGPLFESSAHGYDTLDYYHVDRRLGNNEDLRYLIRTLHEHDIAVALDGVFNHSGRHFFAFKDIQARGQASEFVDWYSGLDFERTSPAGDAFMYDGWNGCYDIVKFNGRSRAVRKYLFEAVEMWIKEFDIDGLRLDAADKLTPDFMDKLSLRLKTRKPDFWLAGEVVFGDYRHWACPNRLDSVTNYELYKGLWSSFNDKNFFEIAWTLNRQSGPEGIYRDIALYNFADNHDVNRVASILKCPAALFPLYGLLFTIPGIPSVYYGSEYGIRGEKLNDSDAGLRPAWGEITRQEALAPIVDADALFHAICRFSAIRKKSAPLKYGSYRQLHVSHEQFAFMRDFTDCNGKAEAVLVAVNSAESERHLNLTADCLGGVSHWRDILSEDIFSLRNGHLDITLYPSWLRILKSE